MRRLRSNKQSTIRNLAAIRRITRRSFPALAQHTEAVAKSIDRLEATMRVAPVMVDRLAGKLLGGKYGEWVQAVKDGIAKEK